jgi:hypothetical protein
MSPGYKKYGPPVLIATIVEEEQSAAVPASMEVAAAEVLSVEQLAAVAVGLKDGEGTAGETAAEEQHVAAQAIA